jgi:hypothetical protein
MYAWVTLWTTLVVYLALASWTYRRGHIWLGYVLAAAAGLYTHHYAVFGIAIANIAFLYLLVRGRVARSLLLSWIGAQVGVVLLFGPWLPVFLRPVGGGGGWLTLGLGKPSLVVLPQTAVLYMVGTGRALYPVLLRRIGYGLCMALLALGVIFAPRRQPKGATEALFTPVEAVAFVVLYLGFPLGASWVASHLFKPMYSTRYTLPFLVPFVLLLGRGIERLRWPVARGLALAAVMAFMGVGIGAQVELMDKPDWRGLAARLAVQAGPDDVVLFMPGWHAKPFDYYAQGALTLYGDVPIPVQRYGQEALDDVAEAIDGYRRVWFVWETDHYTDADAQVYAFLQAHSQQVANEPLPLVGRVILFETAPAEAVGAGDGAS